MADPRTATRLSWLSNLKPVHNSTVCRKSSIICTIGPATQSVERITDLRKAGLNIARMNFSHGSYEYHATTIANVRESERLHPGRPVAIALDTKGPEIRTGNMVDGNDVPFTAGHEMTFTVDPAHKSEGCLERIFIDYANLPKVLEPGRTIYIDDGIMQFEVLSCGETEVRVRALNNGTLASHKGVNLPGSDVDLPALSEKDKADLDFGIEQNVDIIFASFIRTADDILDIRRHLGERGKHIKIVAKIESTQGVENFDAILAETDGVMIARGDLGIEIPAAEVFVVQKMITAKCNIAGKPVICATQMLESMTYNPRPTRAEVSDVANAILDGADCVMLSGETAKGKYPVEAVNMMSEVCILAESAICYPPFFNDIRACTKLPVSTTEATSSSAVNATLEQDAKAIICLTTSGSSAASLSKYRPHVPIIAITREAHVSRQVHLYRGCFPFFYPKGQPKFGNDPSRHHDEWQADVDLRIQFGIDNAVKLGILKPGDRIICIQGWRGGIGNTNTMRIITVQPHKSPELAPTHQPAETTQSAHKRTRSTAVNGDSLEIDSQDKEIKSIKLN